MKKILALLFLLVVVLSGCSDPGTVEYYLNDGYKDLGEVGPGYTLEDTYYETSSILKKEISENEVMNIMYDEEEVLVFEANFLVEDVLIQFSYRTTDDYYGCSAYDTTRENAMHEKIGCGNTYMYLVENAPDLVDELTNILETYEQPIDNLEAGDAAQVEEMITYIKADKTTVEYYTNYGYTNLGNGTLELIIDENNIISLYYKDNKILSFEAIYTTDNVDVYMQYDLINNTYTCGAYDNTIEAAPKESIDCGSTMRYLNINDSKVDDEINNILYNFEIAISEEVMWDVTEAEETINSLKN